MAAPGSILSTELTGVVPMDRGAEPAAPGPSPVAGRGESPWMISPLVDLALFVGVTILTVIPWIVSDVLRYPGWYVMIGVAFVNGPHLISTWTRVYLARGERFKRPLHYWVIPAAVAAFGIVNELRGGSGLAWVRTTIFYWASWHFVAQSWGILRIYQRKHRVVGTLDAKLERVLLFGPAFFCMLRRLHTGPWTLFQVEVFHVVPPASIVNAFGALLVLVALFYVARRLVGARRRPWFEAVRPTYLFFNFVGFAMPFLVIQDGTSAFAAAALWHAAQYMAIVWLYNRRRYAGGVDPAARAVSWASQPGRAPAYIALLAAGAAGVYSLAFLIASVAKIPFQDLALVFWTGLTLAHYYVDGVIWKTRRYNLKPLG